MPPRFVCEPAHAGGAGYGGQVLLEEPLAGATPTRPDVVVTGDDAHLAGQVLEELQAAGKVLHSLADVAGQHGEVRLLSRDARGKRLNLLLAGNAEVEVAGDDDTS